MRARLRLHLRSMSLLVLGFESSCDETGVALVRTQEAGRVPQLLAHVRQQGWRCVTLDEAIAPTPAPICQTA